MKSYNHLFEVCISEENRRIAIQRSKKSKRIRRIIRERHLSDGALLSLSYDWIMDYKNANHHAVVIHEGTNHKERQIVVPTLEELVVQHCVIRAMEPMLWKGMYEHSYASLPNRGVHKAKKVIEKWIRHDRRNVKYVLKMDIRHFFDSVPHDILKRMLARKIHDEKMLQLLFQIIDVTDVGIPIGFYTSQWLSEWYLQDLDHFIKEQLHAVHYVRYKDDMIIFGSSKKELHRIRREISYFLGSRLGLELKGNWQVFRFSYGDDKGRDLDFMGFRFYRTRTVMRGSIMLRATRKARRIAKKARPTIYDCRQMISYLGWLDCTDTYHMYEKWIKPYISFRMMWRYLSRCSRSDDLWRYATLVKRYKSKGGTRCGTQLYSR